MFHICNFDESFWLQPSAKSRLPNSVCSPYQNILEYINNCAALIRIYNRAFLLMLGVFKTNPSLLSKSRITNQALGIGCVFHTSVCKGCSIGHVCSVPSISVPWQIQHLCETCSVEILLQSRTVYYTGIMCSIRTMCWLYFTQFSFYAKFYFKGNLWLTYLGLPDVPYFKDIPYFKVTFIPLCSILQAIVGACYLLSLIASQHST